jgi:hypothetical protein
LVLRSCADCSGTWKTTSGGKSGWVMLFAIFRDEEDRESCGKCCNKQHRTVDHGREIKHHLHAFLQCVWMQANRWRSHPWREVVSPGERPWALGDI